MFFKKQLYLQRWVSLLKVNDRKENLTNEEVSYPFKRGDRAANSLVLLNRSITIRIFRFCENIN